MMASSVEKIPRLLLVILLLLCAAPDLSHGARILGLFTHFGKSHFAVFEPFLKTLAERGHELVVVSHFPQKQLIPNYTDISLVGSLPERANSVSAVSVHEALLAKRFANGPVLAITGHVACHYMLQHPPMQELINSDQHFDLIIFELFNTDCILGFLHKFKAPSIAMSSCNIQLHSTDRFGLPDNPSYIPVLFEPHSDKMNFIERVFNTAHYILTKSTVGLVFDWPSEWYARKYFGDDLPSFSELKLNTSVILVNTHFSINRPRPFVPGVIEVAGIHLPQVKKLPKDIQEFMDGAKDGVIYFSLGSLIKSDSLSDDRRQAFLDAFSELPQRVLWKWDLDELPGRPSNVKIAKWMPQFDILHHPNLRLYIGHGGQLSTIEAAHCGVPMVGIPLIGDQDSNVRHLEVAGMGVGLSYWSISKESVLGAIRTILDNPSYKENALRVSRAFRDRPISAMDTAVFWTEYVLRHGGARHLQSAAVELHWFQYLLLDVALLLGGVVSTVLFVVYKVVKRTLGLFKTNKPKRKTK